MVKHMIIIYSCYGSAHSSVVAAAIHVGMLPVDRVPGYSEIVSIPHYDRTDSELIGFPFFMGVDCYGNHVYIVGMKNGKKLVKDIIYQYLKGYGIEEQLLIVDALKTIGMVTKIGGFISRKLHLIKIGRPLTVWGIRKNYSKFIKLVQDTKNRVLTKSI